MSILGPAPERFLQDGTCMHCRCHRVDERHLAGVSGETWINERYKEGWAIISATYLGGGAGWRALMRAPGRCRCEEDSL